MSTPTEAEVVALGEALDDRRIDMRTWTRRCVLVWVATALFLLPVLAQDQTLNGIVLGPDGRPKPYVRVQLQGSAQYGAISDIDGKFAIRNFKPGNYLVVLRQNDNVQSQRQSIPDFTLNLQVRW